MNAATQREQVLAEVDQIRRALRRGVYAPHKPLMLLLALAHLQRGEARLQPFAAYDRELKALLTQFGPSSAPGSRHYPFWHLRTDGNGSLWDLKGPATLLERPPGATPNLGELRSAGIEAGFSPAVYEALRRDPGLLVEIAARLLTTTFPPSLHEDLIQVLGLDMSSDARRLAEPEAPAYGKPAVSKRRRDAGFRDEVLRAYEYRCCICGFDLRVSHMPVGLEAAHIQWHTANGPDLVVNGLSLCATHHKMFDMGAFTVEPLEHRIVFSQHAIGAAQMQFHGRPMISPQSPAMNPGAEYLAWNQKNIFKTPVRQ